MGISEIISASAFLVAMSALIHHIAQSNKQARLQNFTIYTQRYQEIFLHLPIDIESKKYDFSNLTAEEKEEILRWIRAYFDLCSEEYYLHKNKYLDKNVWALWKGGMRDTLKKPAFSSAWEIIQSKQYYGKEFSDFILRVKNHINNSNN